MDALVLQIVDNFLLKYHVGHALLLLFVVAALGLLPLRSRKLLGIHVLAFGLIFLLTPQSLMPVLYKFLGIALLFVGPFLIVNASR